MKNYIQKVAWALVLLLAATLSLSAKDGTAVRKLFKKGVSDSISVGGSKLVVLQKDLIRNRSLSVNSIGEENVPELDFAMTNVTAGGHGYRFLPHGTHFTGEGATVKIKYDRTRIPSGYTEDDTVPITTTRPRSIGLRWSVCVWTRRKSVSFQRRPTSLT